MARTAAAVTGSAVASNTFSCNDSADGWLAVEIDLTLGSASTVVLTPQLTVGAPSDDSGFHDVTDPGPLTLSADGKKTFSFRCGGFKHARLMVQGTGGTYTGSSVAMNFRYLNRIGT